MHVANRWKRLNNLFILHHQVQLQRLGQNRMLRAEGNQRESWH